ncbi:hypothetical protein TNCV_1597471 [Trichonephila clavipes]|nr:hypothetical protein TNCV_1597471 [Trichonephila clavipes]
MISAVFTCPSNRKRITVLLSSLVQIDNGAAMLYGLLQPYEYEKRRLTLCIEVFSTTLHSALDTRTVVKPWKEKLHKSLSSLTYCRK